jgi:hypothetical protein
MQTQLCTKFEYRLLDQLIPNERNARTHSQTQIGEIEASIRQFGFTNPIPARWALLKDAAPLLSIALKIDKAADQEGREEGELITEEFVIDAFK